MLPSRPIPAPSQPQGHLLEEKPLCARAAARRPLCSRHPTDCASLQLLAGKSHALPNVWSPAPSSDAPRAIAKEPLLELDVWDLTGVNQRAGTRRMPERPQSQGLCETGPFPASTQGLPTKQL